LSPRISLVVPCYNEEATIPLLLEAVRKQTVPCEDMELIIADGLSTDQTRQVIKKYASEHPEMQIIVVENPQRIIPAALNCAIHAARGEFIVRLDAHSMPSPDYVERSITDLIQGRGDNVGGVWEIHPGAETWVARSIARAASHPLGVGDALYRFTRQAGPVDTVPFGSFRCSLIDKIGGFDESLQTNEDYEFNTRIRLSGGTVWLDPAIRSVYFARPTFPALSRQYFRYGYWKWRMLSRYPKTLRLRQALPPVFVLSLLVLALISPFLALARLALLIEIILYFSILLATSIQLALKHRALAYIPGIPLSIALMHTSWGTGFIWSLVKSFMQKNMPPESQ
jgi:succinoglycan biosynthesis protein ExoA